MNRRRESEYAKQLDPLWYKDAVIYELHVRAFKDSNSDGIGDFAGLAEKLPYIKDLGATAVWLLPFYPSPLRDDGYDISDYKNVHASYGNLSDFKFFLRRAHELGLQVITELVLNHTSDQHPWFQRSKRSAPGSAERNFYVWSDTAKRYNEARIIFKDFESSNWSWDSSANAYYWHRFYSHQPDLNYDNPSVRKAMAEVLDFWLEMGVDGLRLDAVPYLFEREGTNCENLPETYEELRHIRKHVDDNFSSRMLLAEANQWPEDAVAYFGQSDMCHMAFHFPLMPRMFMSLRMEDRYPIIDILDQTPNIPDLCQWALFLRNHDELTLEMVTDEERDYMYRTYASDPQMRINMGIRRRLAPLLGNDRKTIELMNGLLFSLPGTPVIYYGDEIGMGDNVYLGDRNGVRTPMQWNSQRNAGFSDANSQRLFLPVIVEPGFHFEDRNVEAQQNDPNSLLWWMKHLISMRKRFKAFSRGDIQFLYPENRKVLAFIRTYGEERVLVVANLSRLACYVELDLPQFKGVVPMELFGQTDFPPIGELPYLLTLGPHSFYWFALNPKRVGETDFEVVSGIERERIPELAIAGDWEGVLQGRAKESLESRLPAFLRTRRWFGGKGRKLKGTNVINAVPISQNGYTSYIAMVRVDYTEGDPDVYVLGLAWSSGEHAEELLAHETGSVIVRLKTSQGDGVLYEALREKEFADSLLAGIEKRKKFKDSRGQVQAVRTPAFRSLRGSSETLTPSLMRAEQSNTSILYGDRLILKLFRRVDQGKNPDLELGDFLTQNGFTHCPPVAGALEYLGNGSAPMTLAILQGYVRNEGDAWKYTLDSLGRFFEQGLAKIRKPDEVPDPGQPLLQLVDQEPPEILRELIGPYLESARLLGERTGEMHLILGSEKENQDFAPEAFSTLYQRSIYQSMRNLTGRVLQLLRAQLKKLPDEERTRAQQLLERESEILKRLHSILELKIEASRIRIHGDYHLGQVLFTGKDFVIIDFEGEPLRAITERRIKRSPLRDVAGMLRSFDYASFTSLFGRELKVREEDFAKVQHLARSWCTWVSAAFLGAYINTCERAEFMPRDRRRMEVLLSAYQLEKAVYELGYEINNRPDWVRLPVSGIMRLLDEAAQQSSRQAQVA